VEHPGISVGTPQEYLHWLSEWRKTLQSMGADPNALERIDARYNYRRNRITLYRLDDPRDEVSVADTLSHELLHAVLFQMGERWAARMIDLVAKPPGNADRAGGI
jgi:hypothetical protein